jgi:hypothetical protein
MRYYFGNKISGRKQDLRDAKEIVFHGRSLNEEPCWLQLAFITKRGTVYGGLIRVEAKSADYSLPLADLKKINLVTLPRPYPTFLPYFFEVKSDEKMVVDEMESLQISIGPGIPENEFSDRHGIAMESVRIQNR